MIIYEPPKAPKYVPVIDLSDAYASAAAKRRLAAEIRKTCRESGFFYVKNHAVPNEVMAAQLAASRRFFAQPLEAKLALDLNRSPVRRGYEPMAAQTLDSGSPPDLKEAFVVGRELGPDHWLVRKKVPFEGPNLWPYGLAGFREQMELYTGHMMALGQTLAELLCLSLDLPGDYLRAGLEEPNCSVRLLRYPPQPADARFNQLGSGAHTDWGLLTILLQDGAGGLEVRTVDGDWIRAEPIPGTFVINLGDMVPRFTNGLYLSNLHRVLNNISGGDRYSVATFFNPNGLFMFETAPTCLKRGESPPPPCSFAEHIEQMITRTYGGT
jgi:isopenicillin N synthase-like dioxygenase